VSSGRPRRGGPRFGLSAKSPLLGGPLEEEPSRGSLGTSAGAEDVAAVEVYDPHGDDYSQPPAPPAEASHLPDLRELLPAAEPGRALDDWGRSERVLQLMEPALNFYYRYWFRVETEGIENIPSEGGALLVSNHSGALPPDAPMVMQAIRSEHPHPRPLYMLGEHWFKGYPGVGMLTNKLGLVAAHPDNAQRLLHDEGRLAIVFPEGQKGTRKVLWQRYRLRRFGRGGFVEAAMRAEAQIVPTCVVGAEESAPIFGQVDIMRRVTGLLYFPITPTFPWFGLFGMLGYLPAKFKIRFLEPIDTVELGGAEAADDKALVQTLAQEIRAQIQESLHDMLARRKSVWLG
jgi:1-acyl-sn-glycerol-3-phosphate acyltransferase